MRQYRLSYFSTTIFLLATLLVSIAIPGHATNNQLYTNTGPYPEFGYEWENNDIGIAKHAPPPWHDIKYRNDNIVEVLGKEITLSNSILPSQIRILGNPIFYDEPQISLIINGKDIFSAAKSEVSTILQPTSILKKSVITNGNLIVNIENTIEYDGLIHYSIQLQPRKPIIIEKLQVELNFESAFAKVFSRNLDYDQKKRRFIRKDYIDTYGHINDDQSFQFTPTLWIGNQQMGIEWVTETNENWSNENEENALSLTTNDTHVSFTANIIDKNTLIEDVAVFEFALYPTPIKPIENPHNYSLFGDWKSSEPDFPTDELISVLWHRNFPRLYPSLPFLEFKTPTYGRKNQFKDLLYENLTSKGIKVAPYSSIYGISSNLPNNELDDYGEIWRTGFSKADINFHKNWQYAMGLKPDQPSTYLIDIYPKSIRDYIVWNVLEAITQDSIDGVYFDYSMPFTVTRNPNHPYGKLHKKGKVFFPLFSHRKLMKRIYTASKERKPLFRIVSHASKLPNILSGFNDIIVSGEPLNQHFLKGTRSSSAVIPSAYVPDYSILPQEYYIAEYSPKGFTNMLIPQIYKWNKAILNANDSLFRKYTSRLIGQLSLHNIPFYMNGLHLKELENYVSLKNSWNWFNNTVFVPTHKAASYFSNLTEELLCSFYYHKKDNKILITIFNSSSSSIRTSVNLNNIMFSELGFPTHKTTSHIVDLNSNHRTRVTPDHSISIPGHGYRIIETSFKSK